VRPGGVARTTGRWLLRLVALAIAAVALGTLMPRPLFSSARSGGAGTARILVLSSPIHTDIAVPVERVTAGDFNFLRDAGLPLDNQNARWALFGWGGRAFYVATPAMTDIRLGPLLKSFTLDSSVMHVEIVGAVNESLPGIASFTVSEDGLQRMLAFIRSSFAEHGGAPVRLDGTGYTPNDTFFEAIGSFNAFAGCNTWTAGALRRAGLRTGWWNPLPQTLAFSMDLYN
jgi:uncharacterized protein (TIGR02117 family)